MRSKRDLPVACPWSETQKAGLNPAKRPAEEDEDDGATLLAITSCNYSGVHACKALRAYKDCGMPHVSERSWSIAEMPCGQIVEDAGRVQIAPPPPPQPPPTHLPCPC